MTKIAVIPARTGSKRITNKNFVEIDGLPIVGLAVELAKSTGVFDEIIVSLDSPDQHEKLSYLEALLHLRPARLGQDDVRTIDVVQNVIIEKKIPQSADLCCIYPASILLTKERISEGYKTYLANKNQFTFAAQPSPINPLRTFTYDSNLKKVIFTDSSSIKNNAHNSLNFYSDAGQFYWAKTSTWMNKTDILSAESIPLFLNRWETIDIDYPEDLKIALLIRANALTERSK